VTVVLLVIEKTGSQVFLLSSTPLMPPYIVKMTWSRPKMPCPQRILFLFGSQQMRRQISHFRHTMGEKCYIAQKLLVMTIFQKILNTFNCHYDLIFLLVII
jgi:hypothetical protein